MWGCVAGGGPVRSDARTLPDEPLTIDRMSREWQGAEVQLRFSHRLGRGKDSEGWTDCRWVQTYEERVLFRLFVTDRDALKPIVMNRDLRAGAWLVCDGWRYEKPKKGKGIIIDFHFKNYPARARMYFKNDEEDLVKVERFLRMDVVKRYAKGEQLQRVRTPPQPPATPRPEPPVAVRPAIDVLSAMVAPSQLDPGMDIELTITFKVTCGKRPIPVHELRSLKKGDKVLASFVDDSQKPGGTYTTKRTVTVPAAATPGLYSFQAEVSVPGTRDTAKALFEVRSH